MNAGCGCASYRAGVSASGVVATTARMAKQLEAVNDSNNGPSRDSRLPTLFSSSRSSRVRQHLPHMAGPALDAATLAEAQEELQGLSHLVASGMPPDDVAALVRSSTDRPQDS